MVQIVAKRKPIPSFLFIFVIKGNGLKLVIETECSMMMKLGWVVGLTQPWSHPTELQGLGDILRPLLVVTGISYRNGARPEAWKFIPDFLFFNKIIKWTLEILQTSEYSVWNISLMNQDIV